MTGFGRNVQKSQFLTNTPLNPQIFSKVRQCHFHYFTYPQLHAKFPKKTNVQPPRYSKMHWLTNEGDYFETHLVNPGFKIKLTLSLRPVLLVHA